jgi:hypothetical protein
MGEEARIRSSNYKYLVAVWKVAKSIPNIYAIQRSFAHRPPLKQDQWSRRAQKNRSVDTAPTLQVEVVGGDYGRTRYFLKISTMDEKRLGHDLVRAQWDELDSEEEDDGCGTTEDQGGFVAQIPMAVMARQLVSAAEIAGTTAILVLPYLAKGQDRGVFEYLDSIGLRYRCQTDHSPLFDYAPGLPSGKSLNQRIALDITTLLSVVADVCNMPPHTIQYDKDTHAQLDQADWEARSPTLPNTIFPLLETALELIAPPGVVAKMNKLLETIGSDTERQRAAILFGTSSITHESLLAQYQKLTIHTVPNTIPLPVKIVGVPANFISTLSSEEEDKLSAEATEVYNLAISHPLGCEVTTANKQLAKVVRLHYFVERNAMGVCGRVLLHQPRSLRGFGKIVHLPKNLAT